MQRERSALAELTEIFKIIDRSAAAAIASSAGPLACAQGCAECCRQPIPLTPLEFFAILKHVRLHWQPERRRALAEEMGKYLPLSPMKRPCPFLLNGACAIYALRPIACRRYLASGRQCRPGEVPTDTRPEEMTVPDRKALEYALLAAFPWHAANAAKYGLPQPPDGKASPEHKLAYLKGVTTIIQAADWEKFLSH